MANAAPIEARPLAARVASGLRWSALDVVAQQVMRFAVTVVLTRVVAPADFGVLAIALVFTQLASLIGDLGLGSALVQRTTISKKHTDTAFTVTVVFGLVLAVAIALASWPVSWFYNEKNLQPVLAALSCMYLLRGISGTPRELLRRSMRFDAYVKSTLVSVLAGGAVGIVLALNGAGVWALVASVLVENAVASAAALVLSYRAKTWSPGWGIDRNALSDIWKFGAFVSGTRVAYFGASNVDNLIVGRALGATSLGLYNLAYRLMLFPILRVADVVANVTMPALASIRDDAPRTLSIVQRATASIALVTFPVSVGTAIVAPSLIPFVFGNKWTAAVVTVQILAVNGVRLAIGRLNGTIYEATGRPKWDFVMLTMTFAVYIVAFVIGVHWGIEGVAWGYAIAGYALVPLDQYLVARALHVQPLLVLAKLPPVVIATIVMAVTGIGFTRLLHDAGRGATLASVIVASAVAYFGTLRLVQPGIVKETVRAFSQR